MQKFFNGTTELPYPDYAIEDQKCECIVCHSEVKESDQNDEGLCIDCSEVRGEIVGLINGVARMQAPYHSKDGIYEMIKAKLRDMNLPSSEYEYGIKYLADLLKI